MVRSSLEARCGVKIKTLFTFVMTLCSDILGAGRPLWKNREGTGKLEKIIIQVTARLGLSFDSNTVRYDH